MIQSFIAAALLAGSAGVGAAATYDFRPELATLDAVPRVELPPAAVQKALDAPAKGSPYRYAVPVELALSPRQGVWLARGDTAIWRTRVQSRGAVSLSLQLARPNLPEGASVWIYDPRGTQVRGPYDAARISRSGLWTAPVGGDELVVEVRAPAAAAAEVELGAVKAFHGFRDWTLVPAAAGACNIDVTCPAGAAWAEDAGAVARISIGGQYLCTGQLVNNVRQDQRRLFLTANHCGVDEDSGPAASVVFYFNYVGACQDAVNNPLPAPTFQGAQRLAHNAQADVVLLEITDAAPLPAGVYFAGWDATGTGADSGVAIHHPAGGEKKIALYSTPVGASMVNIGAACRIDAWEVQWSEGTTEPGSSGGGLWNSAHQVIGVLSGGDASCANPAGRDYFGRLERAWTGSAAADGQLKAHLDPDNTCVAAVPRLDPATNPGPVPPTASNQSCAGPASRCGRGGGGGGAFTALPLALLAALRRRRLQHHQQDARNRHR